MEGETTKKDRNTETPAFKLFVPIEEVRNEVFTCASINPNNFKKSPAIQKQKISVILKNPLNRFDLRFSSRPPTLKRRSLMIQHKIILTYQQRWFEANR